MNLYNAKLKPLPSTLCTLCRKIVVKKNSISSGFRSNPNVCMVENCIVRDMFHVYLIRFEFHFLRLHINKLTNFAFPFITGVSLVLPNRQDGK